MRLAIPVVALVALVGCSSSKEDVALENAAEACVAIRGFVAGYLADCLGNTAAVAASYVAADPGLDCAGWTAAVAAGVVTYDRAKATSCLATIETYTCNQIAWANSTGVPLFPYECTEALQGSGTAGDLCAFDFECASGRCDLPPACDAVGACVDAPAAGVACAGTVPYCAGGLTCDAGTCALPSPIPAPVAATVDCSAAPCVDAAYCRTSDTTCVTRPTAGMACSPTTNPCAYGNRCVTGICRPIVPVGGACTFGENDCVAGANCVTNGTMAPATTCQAWGQAGAKCGLAVDLATLDTEVVGCVDSWCDVPTGVQGTCAAWTAEGGGCTAGTGECGPSNGWACNGGVCERLWCDPTP